MTFCLESTIIRPKKNEEIKNAIILLHGYGGDGKDISMLTLNWKKHLPNTIFICPNGHERCSINPSGFQWFDLSKDDEEYMRNYITWSVRAKKSRDEMLASSDPYILLSNLDDTGWEAWRQWVRDLPQQHDAPMNIDSWTEPPANANDMVSDIFTKFKRNCETSKKLYDHYYH